MREKLSYVLLAYTAAAALAAPCSGHAQSDPSNFDVVTDYPFTVLGNTVLGPLPNTETSFAGTTAQLNFNAGSTTKNNTVTEPGNEVNAFAGSTVDNLTLGAGNTFHLLGGSVVNGLESEGVVNLSAGGVVGRFGALRLGPGFSAQRRDD